MIPIEIFGLVRDDYNYSPNGVNGIRIEAISSVLSTLYPRLDTDDKYYIIKAVKTIGAKISEIKSNASIKHTIR